MGAIAIKDVNSVSSLLGKSELGNTTIAVETVDAVKALKVGVVDGSGNQITSFGGSTLSSASSVGQAKIASSGTAVQLVSNTLSNGVIITAKSTNTAAITIGGSGVTNTVDGTGNGYILEAGSSVSFAVTNTNVLYINGTTGDIVSYAGS